MSVHDAENGDRLWRLDLMPAGIVIHEDGTILEVNPGFARMFACGEAELIGRNVLDLVAPASRPAATRAILDALEGPEEIEWLRKDRSRFRGELRGKGFVVDGRAIRIAVVRDLTEQGRLEGERELLLRKEREARAAAQEAERRAAFLAEASRLLGASLDHDAPLASVVRLAVPYLADWCVADALDEKGSLRRVATHIDPVHADRVRELERHLPDLQATDGIPKVLRTGQPLVCLEVPEQHLLDGSAWFLACGVRESAHSRLIRELGMASFMSVPLTARGATIGAITFVSARNGKRYGPTELGIAMNLAGRAAAAVVNGLLYRDLGRRREEARRLAAQLVAAEEAERRRLARDLHDSAGQLLSTVKLTLERIAGEGCAQEERSSLLTSCIQLTDSVISQTRSLIFDLYPTMLDDLGLVATLRWYAEKVPAAGCRMDIFEVGERRPLGSSLRGYLYRAVKELMNNAVKHARASEVTVIVRWLGERVRISVADNGCGFPLEEAPAPWREQGLGLTDMRERVALLGGEVHIESKPGEGAQVILEIPLAETGAEPG